MNTKNLLLGILVVLVFATGFIIGRFSSFGSSVVSQIPQASETKTTSGTKAEDVNEETKDTGSENVSIQASNLTEGQKKLLSALGIDPSSITVTPAMIACAETSLGATRVEEITGGATPSFSEGLKLAACYK